MALVEIANHAKPVAVALDWHTLPGTTSERKEIDGLCKREGVRFGCVMSDDHSGTTVVGLSADKKDGVSCGAGWLAAASNREALILVEPLPDGRLWVCAVRAGLPVPGLDVLIDVAQLHERLQVFLAECPDSRLCSTLEHLGQSYAVVPQSFIELTANTKPEKVKRIHGANPAFVAGMAVLAVVVGGGYGTDAYLTQAKQRDAQAKLAQLSESQKRLEEERAAAARKAYRESGEAMIRSVVLGKPAVESVVAAIFSELESKPLRLAGWFLAGFDCNDQACSLSWRRDSSGTVLGFVQAAEGHGWITTSVSGSDALTSHPLVSTPREAGIDSLDPDLAFRAALETKLQQASASGLRYELPRSEPLEKSLNPQAAVQPAVAGSALAPLPWRVGTLTVRGSKLFELRELPAYVAHSGVSIKSVRADLKMNEWTMELNYATR